VGCLSKCNTNRNAVRFPIPGKRETSFTAFSNNFDEKSITANLSIKEKRIEKKEKRLLKNIYS
jgi:hypothetical protein